MKEITYRIEELFLSKHAVRSVNAGKRDFDEESCPMRTDFQRDRDRILHSKSFRRLRNKTQVFVAPEGDHYRTRLTHTLEVWQIARSLARVLSVNEDLCDAIALGHDLGHTAFGHPGERTLNDLSKNGFVHSEQSLRVVETLENDGKGLNLTPEVRDGILNHQTNGNPKTLEGKVVCFADKIAYINHDIDDAIRAGILKESDLPKDFCDILGHSSQERINTMIKSIYDESYCKDYVKMEPAIYEATYKLRDFLYDNLYNNEEAKIESEKTKRIITALYEYFYNNTDKLPNFYKELLIRYDIDTVICDYISGMSDYYAIDVFEEIFVPSFWSEQLPKNTEDDQLKRLRRNNI